MGPFTHWPTGSGIGFSYFYGFLAGEASQYEPTLTRNTTGNWLFTDFRTRLLPNSPLFIVATRWHPDDLIGRVEEMTKKGVGIPWEIYNLVALIENASTCTRCDGASSG